MEKTAVTSLCWAPRGKCCPRPQGGSDGEDEEVRELHEEVTKGSGSSRAPAAAAVAAQMTGLEEFNMENYDDEDNDGGMQFFSVLNTDGELAKERDPHLQGDPDSESDDEGFYEVSPEDQVFVAVSCEEESCMLEMYIFDEEDASMYVHHDVMLSAYPLCVEWLSSANAQDSGSYAAIASIDHTIQIWDLDNMTAVEPCVSLGEARKAPKNKLKKKKGKKSGDLGPPVAHDGAVLCLHGSSFNRSVLASGSADETVKVWDVSQNACVHTYSHHSNKVQCARWHPTEQAVLLSASFDRRLALLDVRQPGQSVSVALSAEAECSIWSRHRPFECLASVDNGAVACYDVRKVASNAPEAEQVIWTLQAHDVACTSVQDGPSPNMLVTAGLDGEAKVWSLAGASPSLVLKKNLQAGPLFACQADSESPALFCFGGRCPVMWDLTSEQTLVDAFSLTTTP